MIPVREHLDRILAASSPLPVERVALEDAAGRFLAGPAAARIAVPPWTNSAMDGYAVRAEDLAGASREDPVELSVVADLPAGTSKRPAIRRGEAARIMTGAPVPPDADLVVPVELTDAAVETVRIFSSPGEKSHIRQAGSDKRVGDPVAGAGTLATPEVIASLSSSGHGEIEVHRRPRVVAITSGDELVAPGTHPGFGQIPDSNSLLIGGLAAAAGAEVLWSGRVGDREGELSAAIESRSQTCDVIVLTGGVSVGAYDPVKALFSGGDEVRFDRVLMQPGKPQAFGRLESGPLVFGLPGNPVSAWVSFHVFVKPALRVLQGCHQVLDDPIPARARTGWRPSEGRDQYLPARIAVDESGWTVGPSARGGSASHLIASLAAANGYAIVPSGKGPVEPGDRVGTVLTGPVFGPDRNPPESPV